MGWVDFFNPLKTKWWRKDEWILVNRNQNVYKLSQKYNCPSWDLEFYFCDKYKNKHTCETRWKKRRSASIFDETIFEQPEKWIRKQGKSDTHYVLMSEIELYDGPDYED